MRRFLLFCLGGLLLSLCNGCTRPDDGTTHIQFSIWGSAEQERVERKVIRAFEATHPRIRIDLLAIGSQYSAKIQAMIVGGAAPDVLMVGIGDYREWAARGVLADLTGDLHAMDPRGTLLPVPAKAFAMDGRFFALPINCHGAAMYANLDALKKAGISLPGNDFTFADLARIAPRLARRHGNAAALTDFAYEMPSPLVLFWAYGANLFDNDEHPTRVIVNSPAALAALDFLREQTASGYVVPPDVQRDQGDYQLFRDGKVALYFNGRWVTPDFDGKTGFAWDVAMIPTGPANRTTLHGGTALAVWTGTRHLEAAREFARFYASPEGAQMAMDGRRNVPVFRNLAYGPAFRALAPPASLIRFSETMESNASRYPLYAPGSAEVEQIFYGRMDQAVSEPQIPSTSILAGLESDLNRWLARNRHD